MGAITSIFSYAPDERLFASINDAIANRTEKFTLEFDKNVDRDLKEIQEQYDFHDIEIYWKQKWKQIPGRWIPNDSILNRLDREDRFPHDMFKYVPQHTLEYTIRIIYPPIANGSVQEDLLKKYELEKQEDDQTDQT